MYLQELRLNFKDTISIEKAGLSVWMFAIAAISFA
jgi:hypothetical protein